MCHVGVNVNWCGALSYSTVTLFSTYSITCENHTSTSQTDGQTDGQTTYRRITALCVASHGKSGSWWHCSRKLYLSSEYLYGNGCVQNSSVPLAYHFCSPVSVPADPVTICSCITLPYTRPNPDHKSILIHNPNLSLRLSYPKLNLFDK